MAGAVALALPPEGLLVVGASSPIRDLDLMVPRYEVGARRKVIANRGLSGIDGVVSTAIGAALGRTSSRSLALVGDVTFLHDSNGLVRGPREAEPDLTIVVVNDDGGSIFSMLEQGRPSTPTATTRSSARPHGVDLASLCAATRTPHLRVDSRAALEQALASPNGGIEVIEAVLPPRQPARPRRAHPRAGLTPCASRIKTRGAASGTDDGMSTAADTFADFVDGLADALDDHEATGADWAARHHFSRFHFDRMIKSVAGEPPQTLRRRILLERAAYRMITTKVPLLDIAVEAGYSSHEAFTRAFTKAYDASPRAWRRKPGHTQIGDPGAVHFVPPGSIRLPSRDKVSGVELLEKMVEHHVWLTGEMVRLAGRLTDDQLDEPIGLAVDEDEQTIRSLLSRLIGQMGMWNAAMATRDYDWSVEEHETLDSMRHRLGVEGPRYLAHVREVCADGRLGDTFVDALCEPAEVFTYGGMIAHVLTFAAHRRTLVVLAFDHQGIEELGWGDPMRWVAQSA